MRLELRWDKLLELAAHAASHAPRSTLRALEPTASCDAQSHAHPTYFYNRLWYARHRSRPLCPRNGVPDRRRGMSTDSPPPTFARSLLAGGIAGTTVDVSLYPIDTIKTRIQSANGFVASEGFRGVYAGIGSAVVGSAPGAALFFVTYESTKTWLAEARRHSSDSTGGDSNMMQRQQRPMDHMLAASVGEVAACAVRVPTEVVKQRAQASQHRSSIAALRGILEQRKYGGLPAVWTQMYRGWSITIFREVPFTIIQFPLWEALKRWRCTQTGLDVATGAESAAFGCLSGAVAAAATTPLDVLKTRMMLSTDGSNLASIARSVYRNSGSRAFFSGLGPRVLWISIGGGVFLGSYTAASNALCDLL